MNKKPLVSVCIPNYNYGHYLENCLESLLNQTYENFEVIFSDNHSTDESYEIALKYRKLFKEKGIFFSARENKRNLGSRKNSMMCSREAEGEILYTLASDDAIKPEFLETCMEVLINNPNVGFVMTHREEMDEIGNIHSVPSFYNKSCIIPSEEQLAVFMMAGIAIPGQRLVRRIVELGVREYQRTFQIAGDWFDNFLYTCFTDAAYIKEPLCQYRVHSQNETNVSEKDLSGIFEHYQVIHAFKELSLSFGFNKPLLRYDEAVGKLGSMCLRYAMKMFRANRIDMAQKYLHLAPVLKQDIIEDLTYKKLLKCTLHEGAMLNSLLNEIEAENPLKREISYDPPKGAVPIYKKTGTCNQRTFI